MDIELSKIVIRKVEETDISIMTEHRLNYLTQLQGERSDDYKKTLTEELEAYFRMSMAEGSFFALMAVYEGKALAFGAMVIKKIPGDFNRASYLEGDILNMYTVPEARRKGISSMILSQLLKHAAKMGISKVALHTSQDGEKLYRKFGFHDPVYPVLEMVIKASV